MISPTTITIFYGSSSNVAADLNGQTRRNSSKTFAKLAAIRTATRSFRSRRSRRWWLREDCHLFATQHSCILVSVRRLSNGARTHGPRSNRVRLSRQHSRAGLSRSERRRIEFLRHDSEHVPRKYTQPWLAKLYGAENWKLVKTPVIARFDESFDRNDIGLPARWDELKEWATHFSFPAHQDAKRYGGQFLPFAADTTIFRNSNERKGKCIRPRLRRLDVSASDDLSRSIVRASSKHADVPMRPCADSGFGWRACARIV